MGITMPMRSSLDMLWLAFTIVEAQSDKELPPCHASCLHRTQSLSAIEVPEWLAPRH
jgi:hypothetical protein